MRLLLFSLLLLSTGCALAPRSPAPVVPDQGAAARARYAVLLRAQRPGEPAAYETLELTRPAGEDEGIHRAAYSYQLRLPLAP